MQTGEMHQKSLRHRARQLCHGQTDAERILWAHIRARQCAGAKFRRQRRMGPFIVDFCCLNAGLIIELDGGQHAVQHAADQQRTAWLHQQGYRVLRLWNHEVLHNLDAVLSKICDTLNTPHPTPLPPAGEGEEAEPVKL